MESKTNAIESAIFRGIDRKIHNLFHDTRAIDIEDAVDDALSFGDAVRSSVDTFLREKYT